MRSCAQNRRTVQRSQTQWSMRMNYAGPMHVQVDDTARSRTVAASTM